MVKLKINRYLTFWITETEDIKASKIAVIVNYSKTCMFLVCFSIFAEDFPAKGLNIAPLEKPIDSPSANTISAVALGIFCTTSRCPCKMAGNHQ